MKKLLIIFTIFISGCSSNKVITSHGNTLIDVKSKKLVINVTNKNEILSILGPPSTISTFDENLWIYVETLKKSTSIFKLGDRKLEKSNVLIVKLNKEGILKKKDFFDLDKMNEVNFDETITMSDYDKNSYVYSLLTSLREKINSPVKRKRISEKK